MYLQYFVTIPIKISHCRTLHICVAAQHSYQYHNVIGDERQSSLVISKEGDVLQISGVDTLVMSSGGHDLQTSVKLVAIIVGLVTDVVDPCKADNVFTSGNSILTLVRPQTCMYSQGYMLYEVYLCQRASVVLLIVRMYQMPGD